MKFSKNIILKITWIIYCASLLHVHVGTSTGDINIYSYIFACKYLSSLWIKKYLCVRREYVCVFISVCVWGSAVALGMAAVGAEDNLLVLVFALPLYLRQGLFAVV